MMILFTYLSYGYGGRVVEVGLRSGDVFTFRYLGNDVALFLNSFSGVIFDVLFESFLSGAYDDLSISSGVVDVSAFVGDSAIYFMLRGAEKVFALEPHPGAYQEMLENIKLNNMEDRIMPMNVALGNKPGIARIASVSIGNTVGTYHRNSKMGVYEIRAVTLGELISRYNLKPNLLKMDCEGCEYDVILGDYDHVKLFREVVIEYHKGYEELLEVLKMDFVCRYEAKHLFRDLSKQGLLYCIRQGF